MVQSIAGGWAADGVLGVEMAAPPCGASLASSSIWACCSDPSAPQGPPSRPAEELGGQVLAWAEVCCPLSPLMSVSASPCTTSQNAFMVISGSMLQVANVNAKDGTCTLKDCVYKDVQKDWPGYSEGDQQLLKRMLIR